MLGLVGADHPAREDQVHRLGLADRAGQALAAAHPGHHAEGNLGLAELRSIGGDDEVGHHRQLAAAAERVAVDRGDPRLARAADEVGGPAGEHVAGVELGGGLGGHLLDVRPRGEGLLACACDHRATLARVGLELGEGGDQVLEHRARQRVERFGPVERDQGHGPVPLDQQGRIIGHLAAPSSPEP